MPKIGKNSLIFVSRETNKIYSIEGLGEREKMGVDTRSNKKLCLPRKARHADSDKEVGRKYQDQR